MRKIERYISKNWIWIIVGLALTVVSIGVAYDQRGYMAYGGEYFTLPLVLMLVDLGEKVVGVIRYLIGLEDKDASD